MKKIILLILSLLIPPSLVFANIEEDFDPEVHMEKIYLFDVKISVQPEGTIQVTETITLNARHNEIKRGIWRDLPVLPTESVQIVSLTMDGEKHPFFTEKEGLFLKVGFGNDDYISIGKHTYTFTYIFTGAIDFFKQYDELYWNVTGNNTEFIVDKARVQVIFPPGTHVRKEGISLYTGLAGEKEHQAKQVGDLTFETTAPLSSNEGFTIAIPFDKGAVQQPSLLKGVFSSFRFLISLVLFIILTGYCLYTWIKVGRDPFYVVVPQYEPPQGISPALVGFLRNRHNCAILACAMLDLSMKGFIEIQRQGEKILLVRKTAGWQALPNEEDLPKEEKAILNQLLSSDDTCVLNKKIGAELESIQTEARRDFWEKREKYNAFNSKYMIKAIGLLFVLGVIPFLGLDDPFWGINIYLGGVWFCTFLTLSDIKAFSFKVIIACFFLLFFSCIMSFPVLFLNWNYPLAVLICEGLFGIGIFLTVLYVRLIPNVTPAGKPIYEYLKGFEKYIQVAEGHRFAASDPMDAQRIFCNYLPYAFAMGMYNQWIQKFTHILSDTTIQQVIACAGGTSTISRHLTEKITSSFPMRVRASGGGDHSSSGSFGGGSSGGGHGGGGVSGR